MKEGTVVIPFVREELAVEAFRELLDCVIDGRPYFFGLPINKRRLMQDLWHPRLYSRSIWCITKACLGKHERVVKPTLLMLPVSGRITSTHFPLEQIAKIPRMSAFAICRSLDQGQTLAGLEGPLAKALCWVTYRTGVCLTKTEPQPVQTIVKAK